nr:high-affinity glucose transporter ght2 [Quercus suber]
MGHEDEARRTIARLAGLKPDSREVNHQIGEIRFKLEEERAGADTKWHEIFTGPKMFYRTVLGMTLQAGQQLTGANFCQRSLYIRWTVRGPEIRSSAFPDGSPADHGWAGNVLIVFSCLFIVAFATTWGPLVWAVVAELYPARYRAPCMAAATASNWLFNFLLEEIDTMYVLDVNPRKSAQWDGSKISPGAKTSGRSSLKDEESSGTAGRIQTSGTSE